MKKINLKQLTTQEKDLINALNADLTGENAKKVNSSIYSSFIASGKTPWATLHDETININTSFIASGKAPCVT